MSQALVLSGGGAFAAYEVGVMKALFRGESSATNNEPLAPRVISGTSAGGFNAATITSMSNGSGGLRAIEYLESVWLNQIAAVPRMTCGNGVFRLRGKPSTYVEPACYTPNPLKPLIDFARDGNALVQFGLQRLQNAISSNESLEQNLLELLSVEPLIDVDPFRKLVRSAIDYEKILSSEVKLCINATNWDRGTVAYFENDQFTPKNGPRIVSGAAAIPGIFPRQEFNGEFYVDGSVLINSPLLIAIQRGSDELHVITHLPLTQTIAWPSFSNLPEVLWRLQEIKWASTLRQDLEYAGNINRGLEFLERAAAGRAGSRQGFRSFVGVAERLWARQQEEQPYRSITVHVHYPSEELNGVLGFLDFDSDSLLNYVQQGYQDALQHDCKANRCVLVNGDETRTGPAH